MLGPVATRSYDRGLIKGLNSAAAGVDALHIPDAVVWVKDGTVASVLCPIWLLIVRGAVGPTLLRLATRSGFI